MTGAAGAPVLAADGARRPVPGPRGVFLVFHAVFALVF